MSKELILIGMFFLIMIMYIVAAIQSNRFFKKWPHYRMICWFLGVGCVVVTIVGPLAAQAHTDFVVHMIIHLLLGMLAPLLLVLSAPITLLFRTLNVKSARKLSRLLRSRFVKFYSIPVVASILNIGGLWVLYTTDLFVAMQQNLMLHVLIHLHVFIAGYLFTASLIYIDPTPHRYSYLHRTVIFIIALAGHQILSKYIYAHPPEGVPRAEAEIGGMLMYYGGDVIDIGIIVVLFYQWYKSARPRRVYTTSDLNH